VHRPICVLKYGDQHLWWRICMFLPESSPGSPAAKMMKIYVAKTLINSQ